MFVGSASWFIESQRRCLMSLRAFGRKARRSENG